MVGGRSDANGRTLERRAAIDAGDHIDGQKGAAGAAWIAEQWAGGDRRQAHRLRPVELVAPRPPGRAKYETRSTTIGRSDVTRMATLVLGTCGLTSSVRRLVAPTLKRCGWGGSPS